MYFEELQKVTHQILQIPTEAYVKPPNYKHLLMRPLDCQVLAASVKTQKEKELKTELEKLGFVVHCYREYEKQVLLCQKQVLEGDKQVLEVQNQVLQGEKQVLQDENTDLYKCKAEMTSDPLKDLTLKVLLNNGENKFAEIRGQKIHTDAYTKKYMSLWISNTTLTPSPNELS